MIARTGEPRVAVVHDWLTGMRGGENVLEAILELYPQAEIFTLFHFAGSVSPLIESHPIRTSFLQPLARFGDYRRLLPLYTKAVEEWDFSRFDLVISSSHCVAKGVDTGRVPHLDYCHTPMRYIWDRFDDYFPPARRLRRFAAVALAARLREWDVETSAHVDLYVANSRFVADRIRRYYGRQAEVVHPFVDDDFLAPPLVDARGDYHVVVSALVPYKRVDLAIRAAEASGKRLVIIGGGPMLDEVRRAAGRNIEVTGAVPRSVLIDHLARAQSLVIPGVEDFGITALEAMALGTPVVSVGEGGVTESVEEGRSGVFFPLQDAGALAAALDLVERRSWDRRLLRSTAARFTRERFKEEFGLRAARLLDGRR